KQMTGQPPPTPGVDGEQPHPFGAYSHSTPHGHGHETAAQRYSATRIQAGYEPERSVLHSCLTTMWQGRLWEA
uniref:Uncharacterized protein n=1 Tax=Mola mola TaxID=94237 RepID=A0A3Q4B1E5_MOLML